MVYDDMIMVYDDMTRLGRLVIALMLAASPAAAQTFSLKPLMPGNNLSDLDNPATERGNPGLGDPAITGIGAGLQEAASYGARSGLLTAAVTTVAGRTGAATIGGGDAAVPGAPGTATAGSRLALTGGGVFSGEGSAPAVTSVAGQTGAVTDLSAANTTATVGTAARTLAARAAEWVNVREFGAIGDGTTDDTAAFNNAAAALRTIIAAAPSGGAFGMIIPPGNYLITSPVNWTAFNTNALVISGAGATLIGQTNGAPVVDMIGSRWVRLRGLHVSGSQSSSPSIGIQIGRSTTTACSNGNWSDVIADGWYKFTAVYIMACETTGWYSLQARNNSTATGTHALVLDSTNYWNVSSSFVTAAAQNTTMSFDEPVFTNLLLTTDATDAASSPLWMSSSEHLRIINGYAAGASAYNTIVYNPIGKTIDFADLDLHTENTGTFVAEFFIAGSNTTPTLNNWRYRTQVENAGSYVYKLDSNITAVTMNGAVPIDTPVMSSAVVFDQPSLYTVSGNYMLPSGSTSWNLTCGSGWNGMGVLGSAASFCGSGAGLSGVVPSFPSSLIASSITNSGGVTTVTPGTLSHYDIDQWCSHSGANCETAYAHRFPTVTIGAPPAGGSQATAAVSAMTLTNAVMDAYYSINNLPYAGGTGYQLNDTLTLFGATCSSTPTITVKSVASGVITGWQLNNAGACSAIPNEPVSVTGGHGSGATFAGLTWEVYSIAVTAQGGGYTSRPSVSLQQTALNGNVTSATATVAAAIQMAAGNGQMTVNGSGTTLGMSGTSGAPVFASAAFIDSSGQAVPVALGTSGYAVPANVSRQRFRPTATLSAATITLPTPAADNLQLALALYGYGVTGLTFSPTVQGWTNGSAWSVNTTIRLAWDATAGAWVREQ